MIDAGATMDNQLANRILESGHSRIPVHAAGDPRRIIGLIIVKELLLKARVRPRSRLPACPTHASQCKPAFLLYTSVLSMIRQGRGCRTR